MPPPAGGTAAAAAAAAGGAAPQRGQQQQEQPPILAATAAAAASAREAHQLGPISADVDALRGAACCPAQQQLGSLAAALGHGAAVHARPSLPCLQQSCQRCGTAKLRELLLPGVRPAAMAQLLRWRSAPTGKLTKKGKPGKQLLLEERRVGAADAVSLLLQDLREAVWHLERVWHQAAEYRRSRVELRPGRVRVALDFSEKEKFRPNLEPQSHYYALTEQASRAAAWPWCKSPPE